MITLVCVTVLCVLVAGPRLVAVCAAVLARDPVHRADARKVVDNLLRGTGTTWVERHGETHDRSSSTRRRHPPGVGR